MILTAVAQSAYRPMLTDSAELKVDVFYCLDCNQYQGPPIEYYYTYYYKLDGDTLIDSVSYHTMYRSFYFSCPHCPQGQYLYNPYCSGFYPYLFLREDTTLRKVFFYDTQAGRDSVLLDYSLNVGDSFYVTYQQYNFNPDHDSGYIYVDSIGWTNLSGDTVKTWYFSNPRVATLDNPSIMLYEGRGFSYGFDLAYVYADGTGIAGNLNGYCKNNSCWSACRPTSVEDIYDDRKVSLYPDPAVNTILIGSEDALFLSASIYTADGKNIRQTKSASLNVSDLSPGLYLVRIETSKGFCYKRFVKTE